MKIIKETKEEIQISINKKTDSHVVVIMNVHKDGTVKRFSKSQVSETTLPHFAIILTDIANTCGEKYMEMLDSKKQGILQKIFKKEKTRMFG